MCEISMKKVSFEVVKDVNASPTMRFVLRILNNGKCILAPRYSFLDTALNDIAGFMNEYGVTNCKINVKV